MKILMKKHLPAILTATLVVLATAATLSAQTTWHVDDDNCPGSGSGTAADPFCRIQIAIDASMSADEILVAPGLYYELVDFVGKGVALRSSDGPEVTIIDAGPVANPGTGQSVVRCASGEGPDTVLDGFTITGMIDETTTGGGMFIANSNPTVLNCVFSGNQAGAGGGMFCQSSSPTVTNCIFSGNTGTNAGGMGNNAGSNPTVINCSFIENAQIAGGGGGGMLNNDHCSPTVTSCTFSGNTSDNEGGGMDNAHFCSPVVTNCTFEGNMASIYGGGMINRNNSNPTVTGCTFRGNSATNSGGGGMFSTDSSPAVSNCAFVENTAINGGGWLNDLGGPTLERCRFIGNTSTEGGGMFISRSATIVTNCLFTGNIAQGNGGNDGFGGGMRNSQASPAIINCVFSGNAARFGGGLNNDSFSFPTVTNSIFWDNLAVVSGNEIRNDPGSTATIGFCDIQLSLFGGTWRSSVGIDAGGNIDVDPSFADANGADNIVGTIDDDLRLAAFSPCIDAGDNSAMSDCGLLDLDGNSRRRNVPRTPDTGNGIAPVVDMGPYEFASSSPSDCNLNGVPDACDACTPALCSDANCDNIRDDNCVSSKCSPVCGGTAVVFADMGGPAGDCNPDGAADANDKFHALNCFADTDIGGNTPYPCNPFNADVGGPGQNCCPDGACDANDAFAALNAFAGSTACSCPADPSGVQSCPASQAALARP